MSSPIFKSAVKIIDKLGFVHHCLIHHHPDIGVSILYCDDVRIDEFEYGRWLPPLSDSDREWEEFEERFFEGIGGDSIVHFEHSAKAYFDKQYKQLNHG